MGDKKSFIPVRGKEERISAQVMGFHDGYIYFATDTGRIYLDYVDDDGTKVARAMVGNSSGGAGNSGIYYANYSLSDNEKLETSITFPIDMIEGNDYPQKDDLIVNIPEGSFYRVTVPSPLTSSVQATRLTISGGGGVATLEEDIALHVEDLESINLINGQSAKVYFTATSAKNKKGEPIDSKVIVTYTLAYTEDGYNYTTYKTGSMQCISEERSSLEIGEIARLSSSSRLTLKVSQQNHQSTQSRDVYFTTSRLELTQDTTFSNVTTFDANAVALRCNAIGSMDKIVEYYFDNLITPIYTEKLKESDSENRTVSLIGKANLTHGAHEVWIRLFQSINGEKGIEVAPLHFEIAIKDSNNPKPIIWLGEYKHTYFNYDTIQIPFRVYDKNNPNSATVHFKKNNKELDNSPQVITDNTKFSYFEIADAELGVLNRYSISCGEGDNETVREIEIEVVQDPNRMDFGIQKQGDLVYLLNTVGSGRSNNESETKRQTLIYKKSETSTPIVATLSNFNWYNNGWIRGNDGKTCLRISNGASLSIPIGQLKFATENGTDAEITHTIEMQFKIRNIQNYSNLIHNITRYENDQGLFDEFYDSTNNIYKTKYTNYDSFLAWYLKEVNPSSETPFTILDQGATEPRLLEYDDLVFDRIQKQIDLSNVFCGYYTGNSSNVKGLCLGPQDMFFTNGSNTVSASYVENEIVSVSIVYQHGATNAQKILMVYVNGSLTGVIQNSRTEGFTIESNDIVFNSKTCDIDLYKLRVYNTALNVNDIAMNYAADFENIDIYDQNKLAKSNDVINEYYFDYNAMLQYNIAHPNDPLMPYIVFDTTLTQSKDDQKLSFSKAVKRNIGVEFVNVPLELAYTSGELETLAKEDGLWKDGDSQEKKAAAVKKYYQHHCPSWKATSGVQMAVQGTSSEFYPRRNYKLKTKTTDEVDNKDRVHIFLNRGPFAADYEADQMGLSQDKFILSNTGFDENETYYSDAEGTTEVAVGSTKYPYKYNTYYVKNPLWVEFGKEKTRQNYWYMNNYTTGTTKFTMKIDFMESSGSYNMGFANLVKNGYSKHPLDDYNANNAFVVENIDYTQANDYVTGTTYAYKDNKNKWQTISFDEDTDPAASYALGPIAYAETKEGMKVGTDNHWYNINKSYPTFTIPNTQDYRTSIGGFRVLTFHKKLLHDGTTYYQYIGMYNMLLDKGSDEVFGFKPDKTTGASPLQKFLKNKKISKIAECWEMENNNRTYCSFRDPDKRKDLTFKAFEMKNGQKTYKLNSVGSAPLVADSFEYRYHADADILDYIMDPIKEYNKYDSEDAKDYMAENNVDLLFDASDKTKNFDVRADFLWSKYKNWEKACQWVWSTCTDYVKSQGEYTQVEVGAVAWQPNTFYVLVDGEYRPDIDSTWHSDIIYYNRSYDEESKEYVYTNAHAVVGLPIFNEVKDNLYIKINNEYASCTNEPEFNDSVDYYQLNNYTDEQLETMQVDRLVRQCTDEDIFDENEVYYTYDGTQPNGQATTKVIGLTAEEFNTNKSNYWIGITVTYKGKNYKYDTKEYRGDKFINELTKHFDLEYMATYFVMTEVFECYDSRGKNCMMASWGPQEQGGDYIWYPIFYDIDTQLGVNNTGIPSFEYNVDATEDGNYSTSDSVLWNNFYKYFKSSAIISKYKHLKGVTSGVPTAWGVLKNPPLKSVDYIEGWYNTDPEICNSIAMRGKRPLTAQNLDEYYKYITITNGSDVPTNPLYWPTQDGLIGHLASNDSGNAAVDSNGTYFYMLQGNRSLARRQFLTNRIEYIDSWLNQGNYQRGGFNRIRGRVAANNAAKTSDKWVEPRDGTYYDSDGNKRYLFDAEYWLTLTPTHSSYVTLGDDNEAYPSKKYDGIHPLKFEVSAIEAGVRTSENYPEQLLYIYGVNHMNDLGDMSKLYWQEFSIEGSAAKLTSLKFGYDGRMEDPNNPGQMLTYHNNNVNNPNFGASKDSITGGLPLLKYMNISNVQLRQGSAVLDLTSCEKLENFRATGSNYSEIKFAEGVALNTLYLPSGITSLKLTEARLLKNLITEYKYPELNIHGELEAKPGLYLQGLFENDEAPALATLNILGSGMGYDSYKLLKRYYDVRKTQTASPSNIQMTNVQWSPYIKVVEDEEYDSNNSYYEDNGHYGLTSYSYNIDNWNVKVLNGEIYRLDPNVSQENINQITDVDMFRVFASDSNLFRTDENNLYPNITGIIYVNNAQYQQVQNNENYDNFYKYYTNTDLTNKYTYDSETWTDAIANNLYKVISENGIRNQLQTKFPGLTFFFANVDEAYTARFLLMEADEGTNGVYTFIGSQTIESGWFTNPIDLYAANKIEQAKPNHDFIGWAATNSLSAELIVNVDKSINKWATQELKADQHTYYFYAICPVHSWTVKFYDGDTLFDTILVPHESTTTGPVQVPYRDESALALEETYQFLGWNRTNTAVEPMNLSEFQIISDTSFYSVWNPQPISVYDNIHPEWFEIVSDNADQTNTYTGVKYVGLNIKLKKSVRGKLTIPSSINNTPVVLFSSNGTKIGTQTIPDPLLADITHVFFGKEEDGTTNVKAINAYAFFGATNLQYFDFADGLYRIGERAFGTVKNFSLLTSIQGTLTTIEQYAFNQSFSDNTNYNDYNFIIDGNVRSIAQAAFTNMSVASVNKFAALQFGTEDNPSQINFTIAPSRSNMAIFSGSSDFFGKLIIYAADPSADIFKQENRSTLLYNIFGTNTTMEVDIRERRST